MQQFAHLLHNIQIFQFPTSLHASLSSLLIRKPVGLGLHGWGEISGEISVANGTKQCMH